ncbi:hypothetical protein [Dactylosporangium sp. NPDC049140]|uniref:hypothetical protein n=1 Tax=Dactylosporangium sp. NPDC049140 TaxID=3155647 RepID=UPI0033C6452E
MKHAFGRAATLIVAASVIFGAGACADKNDGAATPAATAASSKAPEPKDVLAGALAGYEKGVYSVDFAGLDSTGQAAIDTPKKQAYLKIGGSGQGFSITMEVLLIEPDAYVKLDLGAMAEIYGVAQGNGKTWMHLDRSKVKDAESLGLSADETDMLDLKALLQSAQSVQAAGDRKYKGTLDLAKGAGSPMTDEDVIKALANKAASVPFTATLDAQGRLAELLIDVPAAGDKKAYQLKLTVTQYGSATVPAKPTGNAVIEAPATVYGFFNN